MSLRIAIETPNDYSAIAEITYNAFLHWHPDNPYVSEPVMVSLLRCNPLFDPDLSLVALENDRLVGHALFSPFSFRIEGISVSGSVLGPISIDPAFQRKGIGRQLIEEGHRRVAAKGGSFSLLCGHPEYYPRFGYQPGVFSVDGSQLILPPSPQETSSLEERPLQSSDLSWMIPAWEKLHSKSSLALFPGTQVSAWFNYVPPRRSSVIMQKELPVAYVRYTPFARPVQIHELLLPSLQDLPSILYFLLQQVNGTSGGPLRISWPRELLLQVLNQLGISWPVIDERLPHKAFMIKPLIHSPSPIEKYCRQVRQKEIPPAVIVFPPMYDADDGRTD